MTLETAKPVKYPTVSKEFVDDLKKAMLSPEETLKAIYKHFFMVRFQHKLTDKEEQAKKAIRDFLMALVTEKCPERVIESWKAIPSTYHRDVIYVFHAYLQAHRPS